MVDVLPWPVEGLWKFLNDPVLPGLNALSFAVRGADPLPKLLPVVPVSPRDLAVSALRFMIEAAPRLAAGELNAAVRIAAPLNPLVLIVGSTRMT